MKVLKDVCYKDSGLVSHMLDIYLPDTDVFSAFLYIHGGGLEEGGKEGSEVALKYLAQNGIAVVSVNYRLYPEARYPDFIDDCACAVGWVQKNISKYGHCQDFYIGGSSAGGYISMMLCFDKSFLNKYGVNLDVLSGYVFDAGQPTAHFNVLKERGLDSRRVIIDETAPLYHVQENPNASPMLILVADHDIPGRLEQTQLLVTTLKHFGVPDSKIVFKLMENKEHTQYDDEVDEAGNSVFGQMILKFIQQTRRS